MHRNRRHPLIVLLCALFLLGAQQAAYAHFLGHLGIGAETMATDGGDKEHGAATTLSHVCTTCAAFTALDGMAPGADPGARDFAAAVASPPPASAATSLVTRTAAPGGARAPPFVL